MSASAAANPCAARSYDLRFNSDGTGPLRWVAGLYHFDEDNFRHSEYNTYVTAPFGQIVVNLPYVASVNNKSKAAIGQTTYSLRDDTRLTLGVR